ncbi:MAG TPA: oligosaccharide flippase family protein [Candidatus Acidoferrum sp.]
MSSLTQREWMNASDSDSPANSQNLSQPAKTVSLRWNFSWTFVGNVIYSGCQWGTLVLLAKLGNPTMVGQYGLALAIATPVFALSTLQLRAVLTTDVDERIHFGEYLGFRLLTTVLSLLIIAGAAFGMHYSPQSTWVVLIIGVAQGLEIVSDLYYAKMQFHEHMDRIAKSMIVRGIIGLAAVAAGVYFAGSIIWAAIGLVSARAIVLVAYDIRRRTHFDPHRLLEMQDSAEVLAARDQSLKPRWNRAVQIELLRTSIVLGVIAFLVSLLPSIPRYFIAGAIGERQLGLFTATAFLVSTGNLIITAMGQSAFVRFAKLYAGGEIRRFNSLLIKLVGIAAALGLAGIGVAVFFGHLLLTLLYRPEYAEHTDVLIAMMIAGAMSYMAALMGSAITSARCFAPQIPVLATAVAAATLASLFLVKSHGILGAAYSVIVTSAVLLLGQIILLTFVLRKRQLAVLAAS